jgi:hypothetical protein
MARAQKRPPSASLRSHPRPSVSGRQCRTEAAPLSNLIKGRGGVVNGYDAEYEAICLFACSLNLPGRQLYAICACALHLDERGAIAASKFEPYLPPLFGEKR